MHRTTNVRRTAAATAVLALTAATLTLTAGPALATSAHTPASLVEKLTGPDSPNNTWGRWNIKGTDLGILWDNNAGQTLALFGDTFGDAWVGPGGGAFGPGELNWRSNVLLRSADTNLADGMHLDSAVTAGDGRAREILPGLHQPDNTGEVTKIPTAGIAIGSRQYVSYMSVRHWGPPGQWDTNYARIAYSDDNGASWVTTGTPVWNNPSLNDHFQMQAFERRGGYLYVFGTPSGRLGSAYVARVPEAQVLDQAAYQYWNGSAWAAGSSSSAAAVVSAPVSELSVRYDTYSGRWLMMYLQGEDIVLRTATSPQGPWSTGQVVVSSADYPGLYGGFIHPWSSGGTVYFTMSQWDPYNVYLMKVRINTSGQIVEPNLMGDPSFERGALNGTGTGGFWACTGNCGIDHNYWGYSGDNNAFARYNQGWQDVHQTVPVSTFTNYRLTGWLRTSPNSDNGFFGVRGTNNAVISEVNFTAVGPWTRYTVNFNSGNRTSVVVYGGVWTDHGDIWIQLDDFALTKA
ncbi:DUF4185 domain-containing protein [Dactylosporangium sp. AC04546]|uniref:DUF4185 domain-containing protein n=1 Tax=Dactylosporangium sp. AC04546 TaxID=2862460 RepID=UPI001EDFEF2D|nr:DUF4185 domain-containing protein [Dactylosporangium sp. AC04546]WVK78491.1 DUF4185 domain-containing protein [Dactylosporangium sp. AC04546]